MDTDFKFLDFKKEKNFMELTISKARRMLKEIYDIAMEGSMTRSLSDGDEILAVQYNKIRDIAIKNKWIDEDWVVELKKGESESDLLRDGDRWANVIAVSAKLFMVQLDVDEE